MAITTTTGTDTDVQSPTYVETAEYTGPLELTREQARVLFDIEVQQKLGITGDEFLRRLDAGEYDSDAIDAPGDIGNLEMFSHVVR